MAQNTKSTPSKPYVIKPFGLQPDVIICIDNEDLIQYRHLVSKVKPNEVQWYAKVERVIYPQEQRSHHVKSPLYAYYISDMFIPEQEVSTGTVDTDVRKDPMKMYRLMMEVENRHADDSEMGFDQEAANEDMQAMHCWCHSHPFTTNPSPSGQDDQMFREWVEENQIAQNMDTPMVALIFGNGEKIHARVYDPRVPGVMFDNVDVHIDYDESFDTSYIDHALKNKIKKKQYSTYKFANSNYTRCSDGVYRNKEAKEKFEAKNKATEKVLTPEQTASQFFDKHFDGSWDEFIKHANGKYHNESEVKQLWDFIGRWLNDELEQTMFVAAMTDNPKGLRQMAESDQEELFLLNKDDALLVLCGHFTADIFSSLHIKAALTFAKRYVKQRDEAGRLRAVGALENSVSKIPYQGNIWDKIEQEAAEVQNLGAEGYSFYDEDDDNPYAIALGGEYNDENIGLWNGRTL